MNTFVYLKSKKELWFDVPEPRQQDYTLDFGGISDYEEDCKKYNSRLHYPVSKQLDALLVEGQRVRGVEFKTEDACSCPFGRDVECIKGKKFDLFERCKIAIPLPDKSKEVGSIEKEEIAIGDLKDEFRRPELQGQRRVLFSVNKILGAIATAYWRGKQSEPEPITVKPVEEISESDIDTIADLDYPTYEQIGSNKQWEEMSELERAYYNLAKAKNAIAVQRNTIKRLRSNTVKDCWISVETGLPEKEVRVLVFTGMKEPDDRMVGYISKITGYWFDEEANYLSIPVTHWMPLPQPPTQPAGAKPIIE